MTNEFTRDMLFGGKKQSIENQETDVVEFSLNKVTDEILNLKENIFINIIEIGKRLNIVKNKLNFGEFGKWLEEEVDFSQRTAQKFMKVAQEFSNTKLPSSIGQEKLYLLAGVETEKREQIMQEYDVTNMTTRELEMLLKDKKQTKKKEKETKFTGKIKKDTYTKYKDKFNNDDDFDILVDKLLSKYFDNQE